MNRIVVRFTLLGAALAFSGGAALAQTIAIPSGHWQGKIQIPDHELSVTIDLARNPKGVWIGSMSVVGSTSIDVPVLDLAVDGEIVKFVATLPQRAYFEGHLSADGSSLSGKVSNADGEAPFQLTRSGEANVKVPPPSSPLAKEFEGSWEGAVSSAGKDRRVALKLTPGDDGAAMAKLIAVDQGNLEIPVATVTIKDKQLQLDVPAVSGTYRGTLGDSGEIAGEWSQGSTRQALTFKRVSSGAQKL